MKIEELRKIAKARTTGRWCYSTCYGVAFIETPDRKTGIACAVDYLSPNNADAIVEMSNHIDALLDLWESLESVLSEEGIREKFLGYVQGARCLDALERLESIK